MKKYIENLKGGMVFGVGILIMLFLGGITYASWTNISKVNSGDKLTSDNWNIMVDDINFLKSRTEGGTLVSAGAVVAFNLQECPSGRKAADGTNGTPDLRGMFIRGANSFDAGKTSNPRDEDRKNSGEGLGTEQEDAIRDIKGRLFGETGVNYVFLGEQVTPSGVFTLEGVGTKYGISESGPANWQSSALNFDASKGEGVIVGADNRPKNIALIYCVKE